MKTLRFYLFILLLLSSPFRLFAADVVFKYSVDKPLDQVYTSVYHAMEEAHFHIVFEPDIGKTLAGFAERWGEDYNRNGLDAIRSIVFCNGWYANQISNLDTDMLALCPQHLTLIESHGKTTALYARPAVIAANSPAHKVLADLENEVIAAIKQGMQD
jgi:Domain of unknown function DUF302